MSNTLQQQYMVTPFLGVIEHFRKRTQTLRDWDDSDSTVMARPFFNRELEAQVRSGDYFITLATSLDTLSQQLSDYSAKIMLEEYVSDLIYLYDNYDIERRRENEHTS
ncbi:MAG TPA: hypothetical protein VJ841_00705 [Candidatus Saccharimonadales bacterium]|nr:hypothetical protein [Candidatus Saccharimonadales bacterium]